MGDIWPYGTPPLVPQLAAEAALARQGMDAAPAIVGGAIAMAESSLGRGGVDLGVINDTPGTGDYSVGGWQVNYFASLYSERAAAYGTPQQLVQGGLDRQAYAAYHIWLDAGRSFSPWSTYTSGAFNHYLPGGVIGGTGVQPTISEGATGPVVTTLQSDLQLAGYIHLVVDGVFGPLTRTDVVDFQAHHNLAADGIVGPLTWSALGAVIGTRNLPPPLPPPAPPPPVEPPGNIDQSVTDEWSNVRSAFGPELGASLRQLAAWGNAIGGIS